MRSNLEQLQHLLPVLRAVDAAFQDDFPSRTPDPAELRRHLRMSEEIIFPFADRAKRFEKGVCGAHLTEWRSNRDAFASGIIETDGIFGGFGLVLTSFRFRPLHPGLHVAHIYEEALRLAHAGSQMAVATADTDGSLMIWIDWHGRAAGLPTPADLRRAFDLPERPADGRPFSRKIPAADFIAQSHVLIGLFRSYRPDPCR